MTRQESRNETPTLSPFEITIRAWLLDELDRVEAKLAAEAIR